VSARRQHNRASHPARRGAGQRLSEALEELTRQNSGAATVTELCRVAGVSRNSLYRYHAAVLQALRERQRRGPKTAQLKARKASEQRREEIIILRDKAEKLVALVDHYYAAYRESAELLIRRDRELAELRSKLAARPVLLRLPHSHAARESTGSARKGPRA
jgi:AcrR family transcriptional regulator